VIQPKPSCGTCKNLKAKGEQHAKVPPKLKALTPDPCTATLPLNPSRPKTYMHKYTHMDRHGNTM